MRCEKGMVQVHCCGKHACRHCCQWSLCCRRKRINLFTAWKNRLQIHAYLPDSHPDNPVHSQIFHNNRSRSICSLGSLGGICRNFRPRIGLAYVSFIPDCPGLCIPSVSRHTPDIKTDAGQMPHTHDNLIILSALCGDYGNNGYCFCSRTQLGRISSCCFRNERCIRSYDDNNSCDCSASYMSFGNHEDWKR